MGIFTNNPIKCKKIYVVFLFLIIKLSIEEKIDKDRLLLNKIEINLKYKYIRMLDSSDSTTDNITDFSISNITDNSTNSTNSTNIKASSLSTGQILGITIPCIVAVIAAALATLFCIQCSKPQISPVINSMPVPTIIGNSLDNLQSSPPEAQINSELVLPLSQPPTQPLPQPLVQPISQSQKNFFGQSIPIRNVVPPIPRVNRVFEPVFPLQQQIPIQQIVQIKQTVPQISQKIEMTSSPKISQITNVKVIPKITQTTQVKVTPKISKITKVKVTPKITQTTKITSSPQISQINVTESNSFISESKIVSTSQVLPDIHTSQVSAGKVMPVKVLPNVLRQSQVLPPTVLPTIDEGNVSTTFENNPNIININNNIPKNNIKVFQKISPVNNNIKGQLVEKLPHITPVNEKLPIKYNNNRIINNNSRNIFNSINSVNSTNQKLIKTIPGQINQNDGYNI